MPPGTRLAQYELVRQAGAGGMGVVYQARDVDLDRPVAIKVLRSADVHPSVQERFLREARSAARLNHPNVAAVHQVGREGKLTFIAMEWIDGSSMAEHLRASVILDWREATAAARDAAAGLAVAHRAGVVHRDVKPANLMRTAAGVVKVVDFGLASLHDAASDLTHSGMILGTPTYLSPEQCRGERATAASDVYALGCTHFHLLTSRPPFEADTPIGLIYLHQDEPFPDARRFADDVPPAVLAVLDRATQKDPADRYPDAGEMLADLEAALAGTGPAFAAPAPRDVDASPDPDSVAAAAVAAAGVPNNLPQPATTFVGRSRELASVKAMLRDRRLVTLLGPGGTGKTRLSLRVARDRIGRHPDGVWFVDLAGVDAADAVVPSIANAVGARATGRQDLAAALIDHLRPRRALLVLDNCEHVIAAAARAAADLLDACPSVRILATSREPLGCPGEAELRVPPLSYPAAGPLPPLADFRRLDAVRLFCDRAALVRPAFALTDVNAADVASICRRLDGIPLAVELAAARLKSLSPRQIADRLGDALGLLTTGPRTAGPRQRTLRAMIDWSYDLLDPRERVAVARLSVFAASCSLEAAEAVLPAGDIAAADVLDLLSALVDKSLLVVDGRDGAERYRQLDMIRTYAAERLTAGGERAAVEARHLAHFAAMAADANPRLFGADQASLVAALDADHDNVRAALDRGGGSDDAQLLAANMYRYWLHKGNMAEGLTRVRAVIRAADAAGPPSRFASGTYKVASILACYRGEVTEATAEADRALALARQFGDDAAEADALAQRGAIAREMGDMPLARTCAESVLAGRRRQGDEAATALALNNLALLLTRRASEVDAARALLVEARTIHLRRGEATWAAYNEMNLADIELRLGRTADARVHLRAARAGLEQTGETWTLSYVTQGMGECDLLDGNADAARRQLTEALAVCREFGDRLGESAQLDSLARATVAMGDPVAAVALAVDGYRLRREMGDHLGVAGSLETLALLVHDADPARSATLLGAADAFRGRLGVDLYGVALHTCDRLRAVLRQVLGPAAFEAAAAAGRAADLDGLPIPAK